MVGVMFPLCDPKGDLQQPFCPSSVSSCLYMMSGYPGMHVQGVSGVCLLMGAHIMN